MTQNIAAEVLDSAGVARPAGSVWWTGQVPTARAAEFDPLVLGALRMLHPQT